MSYLSVDALQNALVESVFHYAKDRKKASGRALGTLLEVVVFYLLRSWGLRDALAIERPLAEFANPDIVHNVEYSLHLVLSRRDLNFPVAKLPITAAKIRVATGRARGAVEKGDKDRFLYSAG